MKGYDLDEKTSLFGMLGAKSHSKLLRVDNIVEVKHHSQFNLFNALVLALTDSTIKLKSIDDTSKANFSLHDHIVIYISSPNERYVISGEIDSLGNSDILEVTVKVNKIEKLKDQKKSEKFYISLPTSLKVIGISENVPAIAKAISFGGLKIDCKEDIMLEDIVDVSVVLDSSNKLTFKGRIVRKNNLGSTYEYGIEIYQTTESSLKALHYCMNHLRSIE